MKRGNDGVRRRRGTESRKWGSRRKNTLKYWRAKGKGNSDKKKREMKWRDKKSKQKRENEGKGKKGKGKKAWKEEEEIAEVKKSCRLDKQRKQEKRSEGKEGLDTKKQRVE